MQLLSTEHMAYGLWTAIAALLAAGVSVLVADPFELSPIAIYDFTPQIVHLPQLSTFSIRRDHNNTLKHAKVKFSNEIFGPESIAFDPSGGGPYTGLGDGRVVKWNGSHLETFAVTSPHRYIFMHFLSYELKEHVRIGS